MAVLNEYLTRELKSRGALFVGFADLEEFPAENRLHLPRGIIVGVTFPRGIIEGITERPTRRYYDVYYALNRKLDMLVTHAASLINELGYCAVAQTESYVSDRTENYVSMMPHKSVATRAGIGWIGKCALLVTEEYGPMIRLSSVLTDAPLKTGLPVNQSRCGNCMVCTNICPGRAVSGREWTAGMPRQEFFDAPLCHDTGAVRSLEGYGVPFSICGRCIANCPYTIRYQKSQAYTERM